MKGTGRIRMYLLLSFLGGVLVLVIALVGLQDDVALTSNERRFVVTPLNVACALGISMALRPNWRKRWFGDEGTIDGGSDDANEPLPGPRRRGHHPECETYASHTLTWRGKVRCAGCTGLAIGAFLVIVLGIVYVRVPTSITWAAGPALVLAGVSLVALDLFAAWAGGIDPRANMTLNCLMVLGFAFVSIGLLEATGEWTWGLVGVVFSVLWMDTRIQLSRWYHAAVCTVCPEGCKAYLL